MKLLYKAFACETINGGKLLLPGYPVDPASKLVQAGEKLLVELADGTVLKTTVIDTKLLNLDEAVMTQLRVRATPGFYYVIQVPDNFSPTAVELGVQVQLDDSASNATASGSGS